MNHTAKLLLTFTVSLPESPETPIQISDVKAETPFQPKFKVGDRVKATSSVGFIEDTVSRLEDGLYHLDGGGWWKESQLELIPWTLSRHIPGFRALADGEEWHRNDFTEEMLPEGWRPFLLGEAGTGEIQVFGGDWMEQSRCQDKEPSKSTHRHCRTNRPLPTLPTERVALTFEEWWDSADHALAWGRHGKEVALAAWQAATASRAE